jgi:ABC-type sulfate transport system permease component
MKGVVKTVLDLPIAFPELVPGLCLLLLFGSTFVGTLFNALGLQFVFTKQGTVVAQFFTALPYASRILKSTFDYIDPKLEFVSRSLGYSIWETFRNVSLPLAKNGILAATVISFARCIGTFGTVLILGGGTYMKTEVLPMTLYFNISYGNMGMALTSGIVLTVVSFEAIYFLNGPRWAYELPGGCRSACPAGGVPVGGDFTGPRPWRLPDHHRPHRCRQDDFHRSPGGVLAAGSGAHSAWRPGHYP